MGDATCQQPKALEFLDRDRLLLRVLPLFDLERKELVGLGCLRCVLKAP